MKLKRRFIQIRVTALILYFFFCPMFALADERTMREKIDKIIEEFLEEHDVPGLSVSVQKNERFLINRGYGLANIEHNIPSTPETVYRIGSITKQFTATAIMYLVEKGKLRLDDSITKYIKTYPSAGDRIRIHHLLTHTSGIPNYLAQSSMFWDAPGINRSHEQVLALFKDEALEFEPGASWAYNNSGYYLLGMIIEKVSGKKYQEFLDNTFFTPLSLNSMEYCDSRKIIKNAAYGYDLEKGETVITSGFNFDITYAAGALCGTSKDLVRWNNLLHTGKVISYESLQKMIQPTKTLDGKIHKYGFGLGLGLPNFTLAEYISHDGGVNGFRSYLSYYPNEKITIAVQINSEKGEAINLEQRIVAQLLGNN